MTGDKHTRARAYDRTDPFLVGRDFAKSSSACAKAAFSAPPESIRAISCTRDSPLNVTADAMVLPAFTALETWIWVEARAAT